MVLLRLAGNKRRKHQPQGVSKKAREPAGRKLRFEPLEDRALLSSTVASAAQHETLADLPVATQQSVLSAIDQDQSAYYATSAAAGVTLANPANGSAAQSQSGPVQTAKLTASDGAANDEFGDSVSISGNTMVVGADDATVGSNNGQGAAYVFTQSGSVWTQTAKLTASDGAARNFFGSSVSISGNTVVVGAHGNNSFQGAAYVFTQSGSVWTQTAKLIASDGAADDFFGWSVSISGNTMFVGADGSNIGQGAAYVFTQSGSVWTQTAKLIASDGADYNYFGDSVSISGNTAVVGECEATVGTNINQGAAYVFTQSGSAWTQTAKLTASDGASGNLFGVSVSISGNTVAVGAQYSAVGTNVWQGAVYVFTQSGSAWTQTAKLTASNGAADDEFGSSVSISGNTVVVDSVRGTAYVFIQSGSAWAQTAKLTDSDGASIESASISGNTVVAGAAEATVGTNSGQGAAYVFALPPTVASISAPSGWTVGGTAVTITGTGFTGATAVDFGTVAASSFTVNSDTQITAISPAESAGMVDVTVVAPDVTSGVSAADQFSYLAASGTKLTAPDGAASSYFGASVSISGNTMVVGAENATVGSNSDEGAVYVFTQSGSTWTQTAELTASDGAADNYFGDSVSISGNTIVVGAFGATVGSNGDQGAVYVFTQSGSTWTQTAKLAASDGTAASYFGGSVSISGNTVVVGAIGATVGTNSYQGAAYVYTESGSAWTQTAKLTAADGAADSYFGWSVSINASTVVVGAYYVAPGAAYVFTESGSTWTQTAKLTASDGVANSEFGYSVSISGATIVVGSPGDTVGSNAWQGAAYVFTESGSAWSQTAKLTAADGAAGDEFGSSVSISGSTVVVGASDATVGTNALQGAAYVFTQSGSAWTQTAKLTASDGAADNYFGWSVSLSGSTVVVGADDATVGSNSDQGAAYLFAGVPPTVTGVSPPAAPLSGTSVTITGTNFTGATAVDFGTVPATSFTINSATQITATSPAESAGTVDVTVVTPGGTSTVNPPADQFSYVVAPAVTGLSPSLGPLAGGTTVTITGTGFTGATAVDFGTVAASHFTVNSATQITATSPAESAGTVNVTVVTTGGSSAGQFTYLAVPAVVGISPLDGPLAGGATVTITGTGFTGATAVDFGTVAAASFTVNSATQITATSPAEAAGTVNVTVVTPGGTSPVSSADQFSYVAAPTVAGMSPPLGWTEGGTVVTITGVGFTGATAVDFGTVAASSFMVNSATQITATSPAESAGTVNVTVVTPGGTSVVSSAGQFIYLYLAAPVNKLTASDGVMGSFFGGSVSISGDTMVAGAYEAGVGSNTDQGAVYVFTQSGSAWTQTAKLTAADGAAYNYFGDSVSISGNTMVVGAFGATVGSNSYQGAVYVFTLSGSVWTQTAKLTASDGAVDNWFGDSVSISGNTVVVGADDATVGTNRYQGEVYVFTVSGSVWTQTAKLTASDGTANSGFGYSVSTSGNAVVVGDSAATVGANLDQGAAYVFTQSGSAWTQTAKLTASDGAANNLFGDSVSFGGNTVVVGACAATVGDNSDQGAAYVFTQSGSAWTQTAKLTASDGAASDEFGTSVSISGSTVVAGADDARVGSNSGQGAAYVFTQSASAWTQTAKLTASDGAADDGFGNSVSISGNTVAAGAFEATVGINSEQGAAYVFATPLAVTGVSPAAGCLAGMSVTITGIGFTGATAVDFGTVAASSFTVNSATQITATCPAGTGTVNVTVVTPVGTSPVSSADQFSYLTLAFSDGDMESPCLAAGTFQYAPSGSPWVFGAGAGLSRNGSAFTGSNPNTSDGNQVAFLQGNFGMSQTVSLSAGTYSLSLAAQRAGQSQYQQIQVLVDGVQVGLYTPPSTQYSSYQTVFTVSTSGSHTVKLMGLNPLGGDNTAFVDAVAIQWQPVSDGNFQTLALAPGGFQYDPTGTPWTFSAGTGVSANGSAFTGSNPNSPDSGQVAFIQVGGYGLSEPVSLNAGTYAVSFLAAQRAGQTSYQEIQVLLDGVQIGLFTPANTQYSSYTARFTVATAGMHTLGFMGLDPMGGDNTAFLDDVVIQYQGISDGSFAMPALAAGTFQYAPTGTPWLFAPGAGMAANASAFTAANPNAPAGTQVGFLQCNYDMSQAVYLGTGSYNFSLLAAQRAGQTHSQEIEVLLDGVKVGMYTPAGTQYTSYQTSLVIATAGIHTLELLGLNPQGGDNTAFVDEVMLQWQNPIVDSGFETPWLATGAFQYSPSSTSWTFATGAGVAGNGSAFTAANPNAPAGTQVAFLQVTGGISQSLYLDAGSYNLSFLAAQRAGESQYQEIEVLVDGVQVGVYTPGSTQYTAYQTTFSVAAAGLHTISLVGLDPAGGDNTAFVDRVAIQ